MRKNIDFTASYPLLPLRDVVVFPHMVIPLFVGREKSVKALDNAMKSDRLIVLATQRDAHVSVPGKDDLYEVGTIAEILQLLKLPDGTIKVLVEGIARVYLADFISSDDTIAVSIRDIEREVEGGSDAQALKKMLLETFEKYIKLNKKVPKEAFTSAEGIDDLSHLSDVIASHVEMKIAYKQSILDIGNPADRIQKLIEFINGEIEVMYIEKKIQGQVRKQMEKTQKEYYLNEQMKVIKKELGQGDGEVDEIEELKKSIEETKMSDEARAKALQEVKRLEKMPPMSAESAVVRNYIEWLRDVPWHKKTKDNRDIELAMQILNEDHYGLEDVKERIIEYIAVRQLSKKLKGPILCFVGPPGVGKTSLGRSVARALGRNFVRMSLGGVRDEAEIRGHRRTYVGALPGRIIQLMKKAGTVNPLILLDEVDKMSMDFRGDPSSALLEVLDPEQNNSFVDHYMEVNYDLSQVMFITTANVQHKIPAPLLDRMEIIEITSYTEPEKLNIAINFLLARQIEENGLHKENIEYSEEAMLYTIRHYTREAGVRSLERVIAKVCRKVAREVVLHGNDYRRVVSEEVLHQFLGPIKYKYGIKEVKSEIGLVNGLAWTEVGGDILNIEASLIKGKGKLTLTGKLGEVMQESAQAAFTYVKANQQFFNLNDEYMRNRDIHLHVPEGAIPKDGPSAGITMAVVMASLLSGIPVHCDVAMTGEITLRGKVLPIGGLKEKVLAAHRAEIKHVIIPQENEKDLEKIPEYVKERMIFHPVSSMEEVLFLALESPEKFFKDEKKTRILYDRWKGTLDEWKIEISGTDSEPTVQM
ncbi:MAG TPA: endopeptidase La [Spirochaetota bacterium]|nr:endopeptidase La [Spirochaetota bacterium]HQF07776.1 endopeptidase La [Spirochaetota bacterium]HQH96829.1 endopeptidase La [Spirochaetota bacterium]HQJ70664.1 endopeptidase La [Spirochaetota bacterium]HRS77979.1 endopeptidase La [Spirochaetota bacterium]